MVHKPTIDTTTTPPSFDKTKNFEWRPRYSKTDLKDKHGRWARLLYYKGLLICWVNRIDHVDRGLFYSTCDYFPTLLSDNPCLVETFKDKSFEEIQKIVENRFMEFLQTVC